MRRRPALGESRLINIAVGASVLAIPPSGAAFGGPHVHATSGPHTTATTGPHAHATKLRVPRRHLNVAGGKDVHVRGVIVPALPGRGVRLQGLISGGWDTLATTWTGEQGRFDLRFSPHTLGRERLRVQSGGHGILVRSPAGSVTVYRASTASWYYDTTGQTACGFHARYGVANLSLPCGTKVKFMDGARTVTAVVDDRGPYVSGREWDLGQNTAAALGFYGVGSVWSTR
jgi:hypothetical protein